uniref:GPAT/DHAPAT C-terminal domain-containing protein n=1 Tax=Strigamia maritima TaxID=126957 RepID=T1JIK0_STRMM
MMLLSHYSNQLLHLVVRPAIIAVVLIQFNYACEKSVLYDYYTFLEGLLSHDFIFEPGESDFAFKQTLLHLESMNAVVSCNNEWVEASRGNEYLFKYLICVMDPFLVAYKVVYNVILHIVSVGLTLTVRLIVQYAQACIEELLLKECVTSFVSLSLDTLNNAVMAFVQMKILEKDNGTLIMNPAFYSIADNLDKLIWLPDKTIKDHLNCIIIDSQAKAKL